MPGENQQVTIDMKDLPGILAKAIEGMEFPQIKALKDDMARVERASLFPGGDGALLETCGKSIIDTRYFRKDFRRDGGPHDAVALAKGLGASGGGPWLSLSPAMQKFAQVLKCRGDYNKAQSMGFDIREYSAMVEAENVKVTGPLTTNDAGVLVPIEFLAVVIEFATAQSAILPKLWRLPLGAQTLRIPRLVQAAGSYFGGIHLYHPGEAGLKTKTKPVFDHVELNAKKLIGLIALTDEVIADSSINIINYVTSIFVRAFQWETEHEVIAGTGLNDQMLGILLDPNVIPIPRATAGQIDYDDVIDLDSQLDENFDNLTYICRKASCNALRKLKDTNKQPIYHDGYSAFFGQAMSKQLNGYPVVCTRNAKPYGQKGDLILAALEFYLWGVRQNLTIDTSRDRYFEYDETAIRFVLRQDGAPGVPDGFTYLDDSTS
jgi:HK97 family phage major capsid protein